MKAPYLTFPRDRAGLFPMCVLREYFFRNRIWKFNIYQSLQVHPQALKVKLLWKFRVFSSEGSGFWFSNCLILVLFNHCKSRLTSTNFVTDPLCLRKITLSNSVHFMSAVRPNQIKFNQANSCNTRPPSGLENQICIQNALKTWPSNVSKVFHMAA